MRPVPVVFLLFPFSDQLTVIPLLALQKRLEKKTHIQAMDPGYCSRDSAETYTSGSWRRGNRTTSRCASGRASSGDLGYPVSISFHDGYIEPWTPSRERKSQSRAGRETYRNDGTECASCCGAYRSWTFPSLHPSVNQTHPQNIHIKRIPRHSEKKSSIRKKATRRG